MVKASSAAASQFTNTPSVMTERADRTRPKLSASPAETRPDGTGRVAVRVITASMSASYHMLSAPEAPAPTAIAAMAISAMNGLSVAGAAIRPTKAVKTTRDMTRGLRRRTKSPAVASERPETAPSMRF